MRVSGSVLAEKGVYIQMASQRTLAAFGKLTNLYEHLSKLLGSSTRVCELVDMIRQAEGNELARANPELHGVRGTVNVGIILQDVSIVTPAGVCLADRVNVMVQPRRSLIVTGPNGSGKTSIFRVLAGLWPLHNGHVSVPAGSMLLVPQRTYCPFGTLRDQVTYPMLSKTPTAADDARVMEALQQVGIAHLVEREGGLDTKKFWEDILSLGEQQRMGLARVFYHKPNFASLLLLLLFRMEREEMANRFFFSFSFTLN